ncbi:MAG: polysaccharide pyruvyl transferase family protein [Verrucomicrobiota bacterium]
MRRKVLQIVGPCWVNKGDRLMVEALQQRLSGAYYLPMPAGLNTPASKFWGPSNIGQMLGQAACRLAQVLAHGKPEVILDCSGYQFGDPWAALAKVQSLRLLMYQLFSGAGGKIVMLPQSLGPFRDRRVASVAAGILHLADLIFVRESVSRQHALDLGCPPARIRIAPDYSILVPPQVPDCPDEWAHRVCVVPSQRMIDKTPPEAGSTYVAALQRCFDWIWDQGLEPCILVHDTEDRPLARSLQESATRPLKVFDPPPRKAKGILGACRAVVGSRYHALVGALSLGTPAIGTGWSHKYRGLFQDYSCEECLIDRFDSDADLVERLRLVVEKSSRDRLVEKLLAEARNHRARTLSMFAELQNLLA